MLRLVEDEVYFENYGSVNNEGNMKIYDSVDWYIGRSVGVKYGRGIDGRVYSDVGAEFGSSDGEVV